MGRGLDNYYLVLGLDFLKPESDAAMIESRMQERFRFWNSDSHSQETRQKYQRYKAMFLDMAKVMKTESLRKAEAEDALQFVEKVLKEELIDFTGKKEIAVFDAKPIMEKAGIGKEIFEKITGMKIVDTSCKIPYIAITEPLASRTGKIFLQTILKIDRDKQEVFLQKFTDECGDDSWEENSHLKEKLASEEEIPQEPGDVTAIIQNQSSFGNTKEIIINKTERLHSDLVISLQWPEDTDSILVIYGEYGFAENPQDRRGNNIRNISKAQFYADTGLIIANIERKDYYITLYGISSRNGQTVYSEGTRVLFPNKPRMEIYYSIKIRGIFEKMVEMEFCSSVEEFVLPALDIVLKREGIPVYASSGTVVDHIQEQWVRGSYKYLAPVQSFPRGGHLKPFFSDEEEYEKTSLRPACGTRFRVN